MIPDGDTATRSGHTSKPPLAIRVVSSVVGSSRQSPGEGWGVAFVFTYESTMTRSPDLSEAPAQQRWAGTMQRIARLSSVVSLRAANVRLAAEAGIVVSKAARP